MNEYIEISAVEALQICKNSLCDYVLSIVQNLEDDNINSFKRKPKDYCFRFIEEAKTIIYICDEFVIKLKCFTEKQDDIYNIKNIGLMNTILLKA